jgi:hypothetical protein
MTVTFRFAARRHAQPVTGALQRPQGSVRDLGEVAGCRRDLVLETLSKHRLRTQLIRTRTPVLILKDGRAVERLLFMTNIAQQHTIHQLVTFGCGGYNLGKQPAAYFSCLVASPLTHPAAAYVR